MLEMDLQELSWNDIPVATENLESLPHNEEISNEVTFSVSALAQEIQVDITASYYDWVSAERVLTTSLAVACLCHSPMNISNNYSSSLNSPSKISSYMSGPIGFETHEGHSCDECGGSIENGKCSKCGHAHHH